MSGSDLTNKLVAAGMAWLPASLLGETQGGNVISVLDYGATGNGVTDDTAAIQAAALSLTNGGTLLLPAGYTFLVSNTIAVTSNTTVQGYSATLLASSTFPRSGLILANVNRNVSVLTDHDIAVLGLTLDYGASSPNAAAHAMHFHYVQNVHVTDCTAQARGAGDCFTFVACYNVTVKGCSAIGFVGAAYDVFSNPQYHRIIGCYAETTGTAQMVAVNPEDVSEVTTGLSVISFVMTGCTMIVTGSHNAAPIQIEPLIAGNTVSDVVITGNTFTNCSVFARGATTNFICSNNVFDTCIGGSEVIATYPLHGGTPENFMISGNTILNPNTSGGSSGVIRVQCNAATVTGNAIYGETINGIYTSTNTPIVIGNFISGGLIGTPDAIAQTGSMQIGNGLTFGSQIASGPQDMSNHLELYGTTYGLCVTANQFNFNSSSTLAAHVFYGGSTRYGYINGFGLNAADVGTQSAANGTFNQLTTNFQTKLGSASPGSDVIIGKESAVATNATTGFLVIPFCAGQPTGTPTNAALGICLIYDTTNHKLWGYDNGTATWKGVAFT